jgi:hypothetical protein
LCEASILHFAKQALCVHFTNQSALAAYLNEQLMRYIEMGYCVFWLCLRVQVDATSFESSQVLIGHEHFVACAIQLPACPAHPSGAIASGGYDRTMSGQTIVKPVINIWEAGAIVATLEVRM